MPILLIHDTHPRPRGRVRKMLQAVHKAVVEALEAPPGAIWVRYQPGTPENYWEGERGKPEGRQVLVFANLAEGRPYEKVRRLFGAVSSAIGRVFEMDPMYVWLRIDEFPLEKVGQGDKSYAELRAKK